MGGVDVKGPLYDMCRAGTDPAITLALEEMLNPLARFRRQLANITMSSDQEEEFQRRVSLMTNADE